MNEAAEYELLWYHNKMTCRGNLVLIIMFAGFPISCVANYNSKLPCNSGSEELCSWTDTNAKQTQPSFSFNQCVGLNYDFNNFFEQVLSVYSALEKLEFLSHPPLLSEVLCSLCK
jgi:hypothetical protein